MVRNLIIILILTTFVFSITVAQDPVPPLNTDRPTVSFGPVPVPKKHLQIESGTFLDITPTVETWMINSTLFRYGVSNSVDIRLVSELSDIKIDNPKLDVDELAVRNLQLGFKYRFVSKEKFEMGWIMMVAFPNTNTTIQDIYGNVIGVTNVVSASHPFMNVLSFTYNLGYKKLDEFKDIMSYSFLASTAFMDNLGFYAELYGEWLEMEEKSTGFGSGFTYLLRENLQVDISYSFNLNNDQNLYGLGVSWRIPGHHNEEVRIRNSD